jgi:UPF0716 family protein affecting phage T7 exclusion
MPKFVTLFLLALLALAGALLAPAHGESYYLHRETRTGASQPAGAH